MDKSRLTILTDHVNIYLYFWEVLNYCKQFYKPEFKIYKKLQLTYKKDKIKKLLKMLRLKFTVSGVFLMSFSRLFQSFRE